MESEKLKIDQVMKSSFEKFKLRLANGGTLPSNEPMSDEYKAYLDKLNEPTIITPTKEQIVSLIWRKLNQRANNNKFEPSSNQREIMNMLFSFFAKNEKKGIMLSGNFGTGKTELMKAFCTTRFRPYDYLKDKNHYSVISSIELVNYYNSDSNFDKFFETNLYIDDFGSEQRAKFMAKDEEPILTKFLELWYLKSRNLQLCITTNLSAEEIKLKYGGRVYSRLGQLCYFLNLEDKDYRIDG